MTTHRSMLSAGFLVLAVHAPALAQPKVSMMRDPREMAPAALLGVWKVDNAASTPPATGTQLRSFQYTQDGKLMVNFVSVKPTGEQSIGHWWLQLDGATTGYEYRSDNGSTPIAEIRLKKVDERNLSLTNSVGGVVESSAAYALSEDGKTLTMTRSPKAAPQTVTVYRKWDGR